MNRAVVLAGAGVALLAAIILGMIAISTDSEAGLGLATENLVKSPADDAAPIGGSIRLAGDGCFHLMATDGTRYYIVWPEGTRQDSAEVIAPDGTRLAGGDAISGTGWIRTVDDVVAAADGPDGYLDSITGFCTDEGEQVAVLASL